MSERMSAERKAEILRGIENHDTMEVNAMEEIRYGQPGEILGECAAEQNDPEDRRPLTVAMRGVVSRMIAEDNMGNGKYPDYLTPEAQAA